MPMSPTEPRCFPAEIFSVMRFHRSYDRQTRLFPTVLACGIALILLPGCIGETLSARQFGSLLKRYPSTTKPLRIPLLTAASLDTAAGASPGRTVIVMVHPAYSLFFRDESKNRYPDTKYDLLQLQLEREERFLHMISQTDNVLIIVLPGNYAKESIAPLSYTAYLNRATAGSSSAYHLYSETWNSGAVPTDTLVTLYSFLRGLGTKTVLVGGGYIGRCQREFYNQLVTYVDSISFYVVPEISSISPDDISTRQSKIILDGIRIGDYSPVDQFIEKRTQGTARTLPLPKLWGTGAASGSILP